MVDNTALAVAIGQRLRTARLRAGLTQEQLAEDRYTKAYVSALEKGLAKPSMAALTFFAGRLGVPASDFLAEDSRAWARLEADLYVASGEWQQALDAYDALLPVAADTRSRAEIQRGRAEALCRLGQGAGAIASAAEAAELFRRLGREADAALATYWLAFAQYNRENVAEATALLASVLERVRGGLQVAPDFEVRVLVALAANASREGEYEPALGYLEEARGLAADLDERRRATLLFALASSYRETGDLEAAIRTGTESLALFRAADAEQETASLENELAMTYLKLGNTERATELASAARNRFERLQDTRWLAHVFDTEAQIALAKGERDDALRLAGEAIVLADATGNHPAKLEALLTRARAEMDGDRFDLAAETYQEAGQLARSHGSKAHLRQVLTEWAATLARLGEHERAYELTREALGGGPSR